VSRPFTTNALPTHRCGYCNELNWGAVEWFMDNGMPHYKAGCRTCMIAKVAHPEDVTPVLPGMAAPVSGMVWPLQKEFALRVGVFMSQEPTRPVESMPRQCCYAGCTNHGVEQHHFAFVSVFGQHEADSFGIVYLCVKHHNQLHDTFREHVRQGKPL
jgi:hypothetical protein